LRICPPALAEQRRTTDVIIRSCLAGVGFIVHDTARNEDYKTTHLLSKQKYGYKGEQENYLADEIWAKL
jgi:hypothetical protein